MRTSFLIPLLLICLSSAGRITPSAQTPSATDSSAPPAGWVAYPKPAEDDEALRCGNYSRREWEVALDGERLQIRLDTTRTHQDALPAGIKAKQVAVGSKGDRYVAPVDDGWLVGIDVGEFGGGLWWFSADGKRSKKLSDENIHGFVNTSGGILALAGLAHLGMDTGQALRITDGKAGNRTAEVLANLGSAPHAFVAESPDAVIVLTTKRLVRVKSSGTVEQLLKTNYGLLYPTSMTLAPSGTIYVGMRQFVTRLTPTGNAYKEEWFVPANCTRFAIGDYECVCLGGRR